MNAMADVKVMKTAAETALAQTFAQARERLPGGAAVAAKRAAAFGLFAKEGLPHRRVEDWKYTDLRALMREAKPLASPPDAAAKARGKAAGAMVGDIDARRLVFVDGAFVPLNVVDERERPFLPPQAYDEITKAVGRLSDGDESGAITSACGAVDSLMQYLYGKYGLGDPATTAFAAKVNTTIKRLSIFETMETELLALGMKPNDVKEIIENTQEATKHATDALQVLRRSMGDAHGTKPTLRKTAYDALKWSSAICALFEGY